MAAGGHLADRRRAGLAAVDRAGDLAARSVERNRAVIVSGAGATSLGSPRLVVPAYFHPAVAPDDWELLCSSPEQLESVVLNLADGPGTIYDYTFTDSLARLRAAGVPVSGYLSTEYGTRDMAAVLADARGYRELYDVDAVFLDQVATSYDQLGYYRDLVAALGGCRVTFNHGACPAPEYAELADVLLTFEGSWTAYQSWAAPSWVRTYPAERFGHLIYDLPPAELPAALRLLRHRHAGLAYFTDHRGVNPWNRLASYFPRRKAG
ncbi:hypothetical protein D5S17_18810 [Pseudonocardiaceae bacterium YIM PH 21723]|nr:hypothetical protein D5S17_18810 [Pseudonocardiaceae bacterium YIM PH 21723]